MACSEDEYAYLRSVVLAESANVVGASSNALFDTRLKPLAQLSGAANIGELVDLLRTQQPTHLHRAVAEAMTINETSFFRDVTPFDALRTTVLPRLIASRADEKRLRIWSAACSTGQEVYSVAMLIRRDFPQLQDWDIRIVGTDIAQEVLEYAKAGRYRRIEVNRGLPARMLLRFFKREDEEFVVNPELREMVEFHPVNLRTALPPLPTFDVVLLRNVLLYLPQPQRSAVLDRVYRQMTPDGCLVLGNAEQAEDSTEMFSVQFAQDCYFYGLAPGF
jgi:chemotaxis protein methyltransferase CheR